MFEVTSWVCNEHYWLAQDMIALREAACGYEIIFLTHTRTKKKNLKNREKWFKFLFQTPGTYGEATIPLSAIFSLFRMRVVGRWANHRNTEQSVENAALKHQNNPTTNEWSLFHTITQHHLVDNLMTQWFSCGRRITRTRPHLNWCSNPVFWPPSEWPWTNPVCWGVLGVHLQPDSWGEEQGATCRSEKRPLYWYDALIKRHSDADSCSVICLKAELLHFICVLNNMHTFVFLTFPESLSAHGENSTDSLFESCCFFKILIDMLRRSITSEAFMCSLKVQCLLIFSADVSKNQCYISLELLKYFGSFYSRETFVFREFKKQTTRWPPAMPCS